MQISKYLLLKFLNFIEIFYTAIQNIQHKRPSSWIFLKFSDESLGIYFVSLLDTLVPAKQCLIPVEDIICL